MNENTKRMREIVAAGVGPALKRAERRFMR